MNRLASRHTRHNRIRAKVRGTAVRPRVSVHRSNRRLTVQIIEDVSGKTLVAFSGVVKKGQTKVQQAAVVGQEVATIAKAAGITQVVFDRSGYRYHGRIAALATALREGGLIF